MKTYLSHIEDFTKEDIFEGLLAYGLFPNNTPPFLSSVEFYNFVITKKPTFAKKGYGYVSYENMRNINVPRMLSIPHPFGYANLCNNISNNWKEKQKYFKSKTDKHTHKISRVHLRKMRNKSVLFEMNYKNFEDDGFPEDELLVGSNFMAKADISNCYPSIYSHSLSWALVGKKEAKLKTPPKFKNEWFNKLDELCRKIKNNETNGILIGPHSSNLLSEIILVNVDYEMHEKGYMYTRYIDDYTCYVRTYNEAEQFFIDLAEELKKFALSLNHKKSEILKLPFALSETWVRKLNAFHFPIRITKDDKHVLKLAELKSFLDLTLDLMKSEKENSSILSYAIKIISSKHLGNLARLFYFKRLHHLILIYPYLLPYMDEYVLSKFEVSDDLKKEFLENILKFSIDKNIPEATSYVFYLALKYSIDLSNIYRSEILAKEDCISMLLLYLYCKKNSIKLKSFKKKAEDLSKVDFDSYWLFIYEVLPSNKLKDDFVTMKKDKITFIDKDFEKHLISIKKGCLGSTIPKVVNLIKQEVK